MGLVMPLPCSTEIRVISGKLINVLISAIDEQAATELRLKTELTRLMSPLAASERNQYCAANITRG